MILWAHPGRVQQKSSTLTENLFHPLVFIRSLLTQWEQPFSSLFAGGCASDVRLLPQHFLNHSTIESDAHLRRCSISSTRINLSSASTGDLHYNAAPRSVCLCQELSPRVFKAAPNSAHVGASSHSAFREKKIMRLGTWRLYAFAIVR